ncbi:MAPEG family protein [Legionella anisa]|uniref:Glutathione S-transferase n=1 Tax=Legionella anisa TaxID=28082 RepID=A0AAX0WU23_9GAMM|nr:MAPEG family protein [Legionella anisa]AWN75574.1 glutathione S-transferase [Legionella anisa]KTC76363.1 glutathione S-transferase [Legionella anisa]MBN5935977.1 MAPEG family protein [Legionella anisa]MCW8424234.1 MAPEG family protein [Legionella anisa]MCW8446648.1 MAPEG family protein [Legionella anisa]
MYPITTLTSSLLALGYMYLAIQVIKLRRKHKVAFGCKEFTDLEMAIRAHGNFSEYIPLTLILLLCAEANQANWIVLLTLVFFFILGRIVHAYAFLKEKHRLKCRIQGMTITVFVIICLSFLNLGLLFLK